MHARLYVHDRRFTSWCFLDKQYHYKVRFCLFDVGFGSMSFSVHQHTYPIVFIKHNTNSILYSIANQLVIFILLFTSKTHKSECIYYIFSYKQDQIYYIFYKFIWTSNDLKSHMVINPYRRYKLISV